MEMIQLSLFPDIVPPHIENDCGKEITPIKNDIKINNSNVIRSVNDNQHSIIKDIMKLYLNNKPVEADITYSSGGFYGKHGDIIIPEPLHKFDVFPQTEDTIKIEPWGNIPVEPNSFNSIMFDPPFVISPKDAPSINDSSKDKSNIIFKRFCSYYPAHQLFDSYYHWMKEIKRLLKDDGIAIVKTQKTISGGKQINSPEYLWLIAESLGLDMIDSFILTAKNRIHSGKIKQQQHSRRFESEFLIFKNSTKKKTKYFHWDEQNYYNNLDKIIIGFINNNINQYNKSGKKTDLYIREKYI